MKYLMLFLFLLNLMSSLKSQEDFAPTGSTWYFDKMEDFSNMGYVKFTSINDTLINSLTCRIIERKYFTSEGDSVNLGNEYLHQSGDTIYYYREDEFKILYNFGLEQFDTLNFYSDQSHPCGGSNKSGIVTIDSVYLKDYNGLQLEVQQCVATETSEWEYTLIIKDIGHYFGFYPSFVNYCNIMDYHPFIGALRCYQDNNTGLYKFQNKPCDTIIDYSSSSGNHVVENNIIVIYPSISSDFITVELKDKKDEIVYYEIFNSSGIKISKGYLNSVINEVNISKLYSGIYYFTTYTKKPLAVEFFKR